MRPSVFRSMPLDVQSTGAPGLRGRLAGVARRAPEAREPGRIDASAPRRTGDPPSASPRRGAGAARRRRPRARAPASGRRKLGRAGTGGTCLAIFRR